MAQIGTGVPAVEKGRLQNGISNKSGLNPRGIDGAAGLLLEIAIPSGVVGVGVGIDNGPQCPPIGVENFLDLLPRLLVIAAVDEIDLRITEAVESHLGRTVDIVAVCTYLA
jgi:hypothetical protein